jgi:RimJ/RimL family protein N-acetyltransferase
MKLVPITKAGATTEPVADPSGVVPDVLAGTATMYRASGFEPPWIGYLAVEDGVCVGTCAFKSAPRDGRVEIAYFTFPRDQGRGVATRMATELVRLAREADPSVAVAAQTLPEESASTTILRKLGFRLVGEAKHPVDGRVWEWLKIL